VVGQSPASAGQNLGAAGFSVAQTTKKVTDPNKNGVVVAENPPAGSTQKKGTTVTITIGQLQATTSTTSTTSTTTTTTTPTTGG
jgi:beta-lactam-binding protein with PASTA domain